MEKKTLTIIIIIAVLGIIGSQSIFIVRQTERAIVLQLGDPVRDNVEPGLHAKLPFIQNVEYLDARVLTYDANSAEALTSDKKTIVLDNYARWRIINPLQFYRTVGSVRIAQSRLVDIVYSELRVVVGRYTLTEVVSSKRREIMKYVIDQADAISRKEYGVEIIDVRIKRADLPPENQRAIFERMRAERERQARQYRSEGTEESTKIRTAADKERSILLAEAQRKAQVLRGEGDAEATRIYAEAVGQAPDFFEFSRSLEAYKKALRDNGKVILPLGEGFLQYFK